MLTAFSNDITMDPKLYGRIREVSANAHALSPEKQKLLKDILIHFKRNGAELEENARLEYREVTRELSMLSLKFSENLLHETNAFQLHITHEPDLSGLPPSVRDAATSEAKSMGLEGWVFTLKAPSYLAFMKYADNRELRERIYRAYSSRCSWDNEHDNRPVIHKIVDLRRRKANLLGYPTYADYVLEERMARSPDTVLGFIQQLLDAAIPAARRDVSEVRRHAVKTGLTDRLMPWDWLYYAEKVRNEKYFVTDEMTRPYFKLENVLNGVFGLAKRLYGLSFEKEERVSTYHPDVVAYKATEADGNFAALLYLDFFPRKGKQGGAWMTNYLEQHRVNGRDIRPHVSLVFNFNAPPKGRSSLLTYEEVRTLLHEFGHALHSMLSGCTYMSQAGTNVYLDFVELPSQIMENWAEEKEWLDDVARHHETGAVMPEELLKNVLDARNHNSGYAFVRQLSFAMNDMAWHRLSHETDMTVEDFEQQAMEPASLFPRVEGCVFSTAFNHIFGGGYASGYYGYKWAEVLDADAFSLFSKHGIFDRGVARAFRENILSRGGTEDPMVLYKRFRGREPSLEPLLRRSGLLETPA